MMTPSDLRIGNIIGDARFPDRIMTVRVVAPTYVQCLYEGQQNTETEGIRNSSFAYEDLAPIPLTRELLEKCGFVKGENAADPSADDDKETEHPCWRLDGFEIILDDNGRYKRWLEAGDQFYSMRDVWILHLHSLQNLFYAITGKELKTTGL